MCLTEMFADVKTAGKVGSKLDRAHFFSKTTVKGQVSGVGAGVGRREKTVPR